MQSSEIRERYIEFFRAKDHKVVKSDSLVPEKDPTLLFTGAGMNQFKDLFLATENLKYTRAVSCQKCIRTGDIEKVGKTASHHTFFEMLGNFSFGDYFKQEAILWAWEFLLDELSLSEDRLYVSVYNEDVEAPKMWMKEIGLSEDRIAYLGPSENFWPANAPADGPNGPCGPCSEIFFDRGSERGCGRDDCGVDCDCDRYVEIWNLVFTQFNRRDGGVLEPLKKCNIDTGMGLERITSVIQGTESNFETDLFLPLIEFTADILNLTYDRHSENGARLRRIADHARTAVFCIGDGVLPSNEGRGYVLRRVLRAALNDGRIMGAKDDFIYRLLPEIVEKMKDVYPETLAMRDSMVQVVKSEEQRFRTIVKQGTLLLENEADRMSEENRNTLSGQDAFKLYDTYGVPLDVAEEILHSRGLKIDRMGFEKEMQQQRDRARGGGTKTLFAYEHIQQVVDEIGNTEFVGYESRKCKAEIKAILVGEDVVESAGKGADVTVLLDKTPFYGEAGGQVGDEGKLTAKGVEVKVKTTKKYGDAVLHEGAIVKGEIKTGASVTCAVNDNRRDGVARSHTATHLLHHALRETLGPHVKQAGSLVEPDRLRFDLTHPSAITPDQQIAIETMVNRLVMCDDDVVTREMTIEEAMKSGAVALFGEKYGDSVRVVSAGEYSSELCGGTHCARAGQIGLFRLAREESVAAGIRRIEALTGLKALEAAAKDRAVVNDTAEQLGVQRDGLVEKAAALASDLKSLRQDVNRLKDYSLKAEADKLAKNSRKIGDVTLVSGSLAGVGMDGLRRVADFVRSSSGESSIVVLASEHQGKGFFVCTVGKDILTLGLNAGDITRDAAPVMGGGGGGRPEMAQAGGKNGAKAPDSVKKAEEIIEAVLAGKA